MRRSSDLVSQLLRPIARGGRTIAPTDQEPDPRRIRRRRLTNQTSSGREHWGRLVTPEGQTFFGLILRTNSVSSDSRTIENHGSANRIPSTEYFGRTFFGRTFFGVIPFLQILEQLRTTDRPIGSLQRIISDGLSSDGLSSG